MKTKHTPGPWKVNPDYPEEVIMRHEMSFLARCTSAHEDEAVANAALMAATPIMFDALRAVENTLLDTLSIDSTRNVHSPAALLDLVQNALKKAAS